MSQNKSLFSWVITGGVACGKSTVMQRIRERVGEAAVRLFSCDEAVHQMYAEPAIVQRLVDRFGTGLMREGGIDRAKLREVVFGDHKARQDLEAILHPPVIEALERARAEAQELASVKLFVAEVPLYHEIGGTVAADHVIVVASSPDQQVRRLMHNRGLDKARSESMVGAQWSVLDKAAKATKVIWNDGSEEALDDQISTLLSAFDPS
jgi:dephospho-CoA kinase